MRESTKGRKDEEDNRGQFSRGRIETTHRPRREHFAIPATFRGTSAAVARHHQSRRHPQGTEA